LRRIAAEFLKKKKEVVGRRVTQSGKTGGDMRKKLRAKKNLVPQMGGASRKSREEGQK